MRVLCTGGAGFLGSHVCDALFEAGHELVIFDNFTTGKMENIRVEGKHHHTFCVGAVQNYSAVEDVFRKFNPEVVIHLAAQAAISTSLADPAEDLCINGIGTINVLQAAFKYGVKRFVFASTSAVYKYIDYSPILHDEIPLRENHITGPDTPYGISKLAAEGYVRTLFPDSIILRFGNIYGERQVALGDNQLIARAMQHFQKGQDFYIHGSGKQKRDFVYVMDVADAVVKSLAGPAGTYNIATGEAKSVNEICQTIEDILGVSGYKWEHTNVEDSRTHICLDISKAERELEWKPKTSLLEGLRKTCDWWNIL